MRLDVKGGGPARAARRGAAVVALAAAMPFAVAWAEPEEVRRDDVQVVHDGKGHYIAFTPHRLVQTADGKRHESSAQLYVGDRKHFWLVPTVRHAKDDGSVDFDYQFEDFRFPSTPTGRGYGEQFFERTGNTFKVRCGGEERSFLPASEKDRAAIAGTAVFTLHPPGRIPYALLRDDGGNYYYIDRSPDVSRPYDRILFMGRRGRMAKVALKDVLIDDIGELYVGRKGTLRLDLGREPRAIWKTKKGDTELTIVGVGILELYARDGLKKLVYTELGVFLGKKIGTPCDWL